MAIFACFTALEMTFGSIFADDALGPACEVAGGGIAAAGAIFCGGGTSCDG